MFVLRNCRLIPELTEDYDGEFADLVLDGGQIVEIRAAGTSQTDAEGLDAAGKTVMPGLFDLHMHFNFDTMNIHELAGRNASESLLRGLDVGRAYLKRGYTFVRDCGNMYYGGVYLRRAFKQGIVPGPRMQTSGACNTPVTKGNAQFGAIYREMTGKDEIVRSVREDVANGCDFIKYMVTGAVMNEGGDPGAMICTEEELQAAVNAARNAGTYVACHCHGKKGILACLKTGVRTIEHGTYLDEECIEAFQASGHQTALVPTMGIQYAMIKNLTGDVPEFMQKKCAVFFDAMVENTRKAYDEGIAIGWGTDFEFPLFQSFPALEFQARSLMGLSPVQLLKMATLDSAKIVGLDSQCGTVKEGKWADLIIMDGKPDEDIHVMEQAPAYVFKGGVIV